MFVKMRGALRLPARMSQIATRVYETIRTEGTQKEVVGKMQTRTELYDVLNYYSFEDKLDQLFSIDKKS
jgi:methylisocitrate lyase